MFPASAGMIPQQRVQNSAIACVPRIRGDDPRTVPRYVVMGTVFPASAGMILRITDEYDVGLGVPRIRGDDPRNIWVMKSTEPCSPHPRG